MAKNLVCPKCLSTNRIPTERELKKANCGKCGFSLLDTHPFLIGEEAFYKHIQNNEIAVVTDFFATWCGPCKALAPVFEKISAEFSLKARFLKIDTDREQSLSASFGIRGVPTIIIFMDGREVERASGSLNEFQLRDFVGRYT